MKVVRKKRRVSVIIAVENVRMRERVHSQWHEWKAKQ